MLVVGTARVTGVVDVGVVAARAQVSIPQMRWCWCTQSTPSTPGYAAYEERASSALMDHGAAAVLVADAAKLRSHGAHHERLHFFPIPSAPSASTRNAQASQTKSGSSSRWPSIHRSRRQAPHREWTASKIDWESRLAKSRNLQGRRPIVHSVGVQCHTDSRACSLERYEAGNWLVGVREREPLFRAASKTSLTWGHKAKERTFRREVIQESA
ncbi:hypothetical protein CMUS01_08983 [Colletotrichum musicola]|uniref:Uncharacterized protein n=1 Tax=Colletotrichum musicola TaxID=2175873 RepID=A0A8H6K9G6_9PEZI|nr:hypothetical protein CMUS01_08983 [Colletotrichum musicola]